MDTQPDVTANLQRALRRVIKEQDMAYTMTPAQQSDASTLIASPRFFLGGSRVQHLDNGSMEAGSNGDDGPGYTIENFVNSVSRLVSSKGAKSRSTMVAPTEGGRSD